METVYQNSFQGEYLDPGIYKGRQNRVDAYQDESREQKILCEAFRKCVTGEADVDAALQQAQQKLNRESDG